MVRMTEVEDTIMAPLIIPKSKIPFEMTEVCYRGEVCHFEIPSLETYHNYVCMGNDENMNCKMIGHEKTGALDVTFRCKSSWFDNDRNRKPEWNSDINSCYYVGDNAILIRESERNSINTDTLACIRQKQACKETYKLKMTEECKDDECVKSTADEMKSKCSRKCQL